MKKVLYFILALASLFFLACIGYVGLQLAFPSLPAIDFVTEIGATYVLLSGGLTFWTAIPLLIPACMALFNFFAKNLKIILLIITILVLILDVFVLFFPDVLVSISGAGA